jgi:predicted transcriptional regulator of viral defense system
VKINPDQNLLVVQAAIRCSRPKTTLRVWSHLITCIHPDTGEITESPAQFSDELEMKRNEVSRALSQLAEIGAIVRIARGRYMINPHVGWQGELWKREIAARDVPPLRPTAD